jgi:hydrogenase nickel incorporation protein HypB
MCTTCGCGAGDVKIDGHDHHHSDDHAITSTWPRCAGAPPTLCPGVSQKRMVQIEQDILAKNNAYAKQNRERLAERGIFT